MKTNKKLISAFRIKRIREQGYFTQTNQEVSDLSIGIRFAYQICATIVFFGVFFASVKILSIVLVAAFLTIVLPNHPFDYIYNLLISRVIKRPKVPRRSKQLKFACGIAFFWVTTVMCLFYSNFMLQGYIFGGAFFAVALLVSTTDICIPSIFYNKLFNQNPD